MAKKPSQAEPEDLAILQARVERLELEVREYEARIRLSEARKKVSAMRTANKKPE